MATDARAPYNSSRGSRARTYLVLIWFVAFVACFGGAVFLGISYGRHPLVPGAAELLAPAGALLLVAAVLQLAGRAHLEGRTGNARRAGLLFGVAALALLGAGLWTITHLTASRVLCLPAIVWVFLGLGRNLLHRPSHAPFFQRARSHGGRLWMWQAYVGTWLIVLVSPVGIAWSLGLISIGR